MIGLDLKSDILKSKLDEIIAEDDNFLNIDVDEWETRAFFKIGPIQIFYSPYGIDVDWYEKKLY